MYRRLLEQEELIFDDRLRKDTETPRDPIAAALPMATTPSASKKPSVSGSKERQLPIDVNVVDLTSPANPHEFAGGDQVGVLSVATVLYHWVNWWRMQIYASPLEPARTVEELMQWIEPRLRLIVDKDFEIARFAEVLIGIRGQLRTALGENTPQSIVMWGVPCRRCNRVSTLVLDLEDPDHYRECTAPGCGLLMTEFEYRQWLMERVELLRRERSSVADGEEL